MSYNKLTLKDRSEIVSLAANTKMTHAEIASKYGISARRVGQVVQDNRDVISEAQHKNMMDAIEAASGTSIASALWRMKQYERDLAKLDHYHSPDAVNARTRILGQVAKELGDIAPVKHDVTATVSHIIGIDMDRAFNSSAELVSSEILELTDGNA